MVTVKSDDPIGAELDGGRAGRLLRTPLATGVLQSGVCAAALYMGIVGVLFFSCVIVSVSRAEDTAAPTVPAAERKGSVAKATEPQPDGRLTPRQRAVLVGAVLLALVVILSVALVAFIIVLGQRTRRLASKPLPEGGQRDELWYLRQNRSPLDDDDKTADEAQDRTRPE